MSKYIVSIPISSISKIELYVNKTKKSLSSIKTSTGADYIMNGGLFNPDWTACPLLKSNGTMYSKTPWKAYGFGWDSAEDISMRIDYENTKNFISCYSIIRGGKAESLKGITSALDGARQRTAIGLKNGSLVLYCTNTGTTPAKLQTEMKEYGCTSAVMLDGGGSSQCDFKGKTIYSSRIVHNLILVYLKKSGGGNTDNKTLRQRLVESAASQIGVSAPSGDDKYISWYNKTMKTSFAMNVSWCAMFVSWNLRQVGVPEKQAPNYASCTNAMGTFKKLGTWRSPSSYTPKTGDLIFFERDGSAATSEHTGIVEKADATYVYTIEGNTGSGIVARKKYKRSDKTILGYAEWDGSKQNSVSTTETNPIKTVQSGLNTKYASGLSIDGSFGPASKKAMIKAVQTEINKSYGGKLTVDGSFGPASRAACPNIKKVTTGNIAWLIQACLIVHGFSVSLDSSYGPSCENAVKSFQKANGLSVDGICGPNTFAKLLTFK